MSALSDTRLRAWLRAGQPIAGKSDGQGLTFTLSGTGTASWVLRYRLGERQRELTLGNNPDMPLVEARRVAAEQRLLLDRGIDVSAAKRRARSALARAGTFRALAEDYVKRGAARLASGTQAEARRYFDKDIIPRIGHMLAADVTGSEIVDLVERIATRSYTVARRAFEILSVTFAHGVAKHLVSSNPCAGLEATAILGPAPSVRQRLKLSEDELRAVLKGLPGLGRFNELAIRLLLVTCARKGELLRARWEHVDLESGTWTIPVEHSKSGRQFVVPLPPVAVQWLSELRALGQGSDWVLPGITGGVVHPKEHMSRTTLNVAIGRLKSSARAFTPHDLRSTARSYLGALGVPVLVAERCLNHSLGGLVAVYDQHDYISERRRALEMWAAYLGEIKAERPWNVTSLKRAA